MRCVLVYPPYSFPFLVSWHDVWFSNVIFRSILFFQKVGTALAPSNNRSPARPAPARKSPVREKTVAVAVDSKPVIIPDERDDYDDDFDELDDIMNDDASDDEQAGGIEAQELDERPTSQIDQTVKALLDEEEHLLDMHMKSIHENAELLTEEGGLLEAVQGEDYDIDRYASRLGEILDRKTVLMHSLQERLGSFRNLLRKEEELSGLS